MLTLRDTLMNPGGDSDASEIEAARDQVQSSFG
jgi:hypothetical protein